METCANSGETPRPARGRRGTARTGMALLGVVAAFSMPLVLAAPAEANTLWGCTVTPKAPIFSGTFDSLGNKEVNYRIVVACSGGRSVHVWQERWEEDNDWGDDDDRTGWIDLWRHFPTTGGTTTVNLIRTLPDEDKNEFEEIFHKVRFQVTTSNQATSGITAWERSAVVQMRNSGTTGLVDQADS